jgi:predicted dehydrogenase
MSDLKLGVVGLGHWFNRLHVGMERKSGLKLTKVVGTRAFLEKAAELEHFGISKENYYTIRPNPSEPISPEFFEGIDVVQIANPNKFHASQTKQSLGAGKCTITEKTIGVTKEEFYDVLNYMDKNGCRDRAYMHLHYIHKQPVIEFSRLLPNLVEEYGKITSFSSTFFEAEREEDMHRKWLFSPENGGVFMDWVHPFEIMIHGASASFAGFEDLRLYILNSSYDESNPTGVGALVKLRGKYPDGNTVGAIRVGKGVKNDHAKKEAKIVFESGAYIKLRFVSSELEFNSEDRGSIELVKEKPSGNEFVFSRKLSGADTSELLIEDIMNLCKRKQTTLPISKATEIFEAQWEYQRLVADEKATRDASNLDAFIKSGLETAIA